MITIGIDAVEVERFAAWRSFSPKKLARVFSQQEIDYCLASPTQASERFAARFAAREAFYKAFMQTHTAARSFISICRHVRVVHHELGMPALDVNWTVLGLTTKHLTQLSLTHTKTTAFAVVLLIPE